MLPEKFKERMKALLGGEYPSFEEALEKDAVRAVRVNTEKDKSLAFKADERYKLTAIPYTDTGYILDEGGDGIGNSPYHHAGAIYVQDPGAMISAEAVDIKPGMLVADLCASPGGKSSQAAAKLGGKGFLLSNDYVPKRAKILVGNIERLGIRNAVVTSLDTGELSKLYRAVFDIVIADAPCSGEGMFRKDNAAREEWSEENVSLSAKRQEYILDNAAKMVKCGGRIVYSTCTYSLEENEMNVDAFLTRHSDFNLVPVTERVKAASSDGIVFQGAKCKQLYETRRFYPHKSRGEGQFVAVLERTSDEKPEYLFKDSAKPLSKDALAAVLKFFRENLKAMPEGNLRTYNGNIVLITHTFPIPGYSVFSSGVLVGELRGQVLVPSHQFFSAYGDLFRISEPLDDEGVDAYLSGEELEAKALIRESGFCTLTYRDMTLGGGKVSAGRIKNHYPKGLRIKCRL